MKTLNAGMDMIQWPDVARKDFFGKLLPAHSESLKGESMRTLDYNLLLKQVDGVLGQPIPKSSELHRCRRPNCRCCSTRCRRHLHRSRGQGHRPGRRNVDRLERQGDVELEAEPELTTVDIQIDGMPEPEPVEPSRGSSLADHVQIVSPTRCTSTVAGTGELSHVSAAAPSSSSRAARSTCVRSR